MQEESNPRTGRNDPVAEVETPTLDGQVRAGAADPGIATYRVTGMTLCYRYGFTGVLTLVGAVLLYIVSPMSFPKPDYLVLGILGIWVLAILRYWLFLLDMPHRIHRAGDGTLQFVSVFRRRTVHESSILSLKVSPFYPSYLRIQTSGKKNISMLNHVDGLNELISGIRKANAGLVTRGC